MTNPESENYFERIQREIDEELERKNPGISARIDQGLARIHTDPKFKEEVMEAAREHMKNRKEPLANISSVANTSGIDPHLIGEMTNVLTEQILSGNLTPKGLKAKLEDPTWIPTLAMRATTRLLKRPRQIDIHLS